MSHPARVVRRMNPSAWLRVSSGTGQPGYSRGLCRRRGCHGLDGVDIWSPRQPQPQLEVDDAPESQLDVGRAVGAPQQCMDTGRVEPVLLPWAPGLRQGRGVPLSETEG